MKIAFDLDVMNERGTSVSVFQYAHFGRQYGGIEPVMLYNQIDCDTPDDVLVRFSKSFETVHYKSENDLISILKTSKVDVYYKQSFRTEGMPRLPVYSVGHGVFDYNNLFGDKWAYISRWLADHASNGRHDFVPYIVEMPEPDGDMRRSLNIPEGATVFGRYGGLGQFDIPFVQRAVMEVLVKRKDVYFLFANTKFFAQHERIIYLPVIYAPEEKARFIATCDWMVHARYGGESFGLAMAEFLTLGCPVICWAGGWDRNHIVMQPEKSLIYRTYGDLVRLLMSVGRDNKPVNQRRAVDEFSPENVWKKWDEVFLKGRESARPVTPLPKRTLLRRKIRNRFHKAANVVYARL